MATVLVSVALVGVVNFSDIVSFASTVTSRLIGTVTVFCVSPGVNVSVPAVAV